MSLTGSLSKRKSDGHGMDSGVFYRRKLIVVMKKFETERTLFFFDSRINHSRVHIPTNGASRRYLLFVQ
ncbi:MAG TPA: hypothetical protein VGO47_04215, partial [Chlamydiales bacterium]|nr:hypothetical protein [Chlamydiales bacterium]